MTGRFVLSPLAQADLSDLFDFSYAQWGWQRAEAYIAGLQKAISEAARMPEKGRVSDDIRPGYYRVYAGSHVIFYLRTTDGIDVKRILHQAMDYGRHL